VLSLFDRLIMELQDAYTAYQDEARGATVRCEVPFVVVIIIILFFCSQV
jgi:hypothetical protein